MDKKCLDNTYNPFPPKRG